MQITRIARIYFQNTELSHAESAESADLFLNTDDSDDTDYITQKNAENEKACRLRRSCRFLSFKFLGDILIIMAFAE